MDVQPGEQWKCSKCSKTFKGKWKLTRHVGTHDADAKVKCKICGKILKTPDVLSLHMKRLHTDRERPSCDICHRVFYDSTTLREHIDTIHSTSERPRFPCGFLGCEKTYKNKRYIKHHMKIDHAENAVRFPCTLCRKEFKTKEHLDQHIPTHTTEKPFKCTKCGRSFAHRKVMKYHEKLHMERSAREMFKCQVCPRTLLSRLGLQYHFRASHVNPRNYPSAFCDKILATLSSMRRHVGVEHPANKEIHSCEKCEFNGDTKAGLANHARIHQNSNRAECYFCEEKFADFGKLVKHCCRVHTLEKSKCKSS